MDSISIVHNTTMPICLIIFISFVPFFDTELPPRFVCGSYQVLNAPLAERLLDNSGQKVEEPPPMTQKGQAGICLGVFESRSRGWAAEKNLTGNFKKF